MRRVLTNTWVGRTVSYLGFVFLAAVAIFDVVGVGSITPPRAASINRLNVLHQNWSPEDSRWFHHASQGTKIMRYDWFMAMTGDGTPDGTSMNIVDPDGGQRYPEQFSIFIQKY